MTNKVVTKKTAAKSVETVGAEVAKPHWLAKRMERTLREQRVMLEYIARNFDEVNGGSLDNAAVHVTACITTMLGLFRDMDEHIGTFRMREEEVAKASVGVAARAVSAAGAS